MLQFVISMGSLFSATQLLERVRVYIVIRFIFVLAIAIPGITTLILDRGIDQQVIVNIIIILSVLSFNGVLLSLSFVTVRWKRYLELLAVLQIIVDLVLVTAIFQLNAGIETPLVMLFCIPIMMSGVLLSRGALLFTGFAATAVFLWLSLLDFFNILEPSNTFAPSLHDGSLGDLSNIITTAATLLVITFIADFVARFARQHTRLSNEIESIRLEQAQINAILQAMGNALIAIDEKHNVTMSNDAFERLTGWYSSEITGKPIQEVLQLTDESGQPTDDLTRALTASLSDHITRTPYVLSETFMKRKNGSSFPYLGYLSPIRIGDLVVGATIVFEDASAMHEVQKLKNNFIALASHQLKTPIGEIKNYAESLLDGTFGNLSVKQAGYVEHMRDIAARCNRLVSYLLDLSMLERGEAQANLQPIDVAPLLRKVAERYKETAEKQGLSLRVVGSSDLTIIGDETMLGEVISSLVNNAITYTNKGAIELKATQEDIHGVIEISDQGQGIDPDELQSFFHKNTLIDGAPESGKSTGLGLYLAHEFCRLQNGTLTAKSNTAVDHGTTFRIELPIAITDKEEKT